MPKGYDANPVTKVCEICGQEYEASRRWQRWCLDCRVLGRRRDNARAMRERYASDPAFRQRQAAWQREHPDRVKAAQDKYRNRPCPRCGVVRQTYLRGKERKDKQLCEKCSGLARRRMVWLRCYWCRGVFMRRPQDFHQKVSRHWCSECYGILTSVALPLALTRERVRQLVNKEYARLNRDGHWATRAEALASVMEKRAKASETAPVAPAGHLGAMP